MSRSATQVFLECQGMELERKLNQQHVNFHRADGLAVGKLSPMSTY